VAGAIVGDMVVVDPIGLVVGKLNLAVTPTAPNLEIPTHLFPFATNVTELGLPSLQ